VRAPGTPSVVVPLAAHTRRAASIASGLGSSDAGDGDGDGEGDGYIDDDDLLQLPPLAAPPPGTPPLRADSPDRAAHTADAAGAAASAPRPQRSPTIVARPAGLGPSPAFAPLGSFGAPFASLGGPGLTPAAAAGTPGSRALSLFNSAASAAAASASGEFGRSLGAHSMPAPAAAPFTFPAPTAISASELLDGNPAAAADADAAADAAAAAAAATALSPGSAAAAAAEERLEALSLSSTADSGAGTGRLRLRAQSACDCDYNRPAGFGACASGASSSTDSAALAEEATDTVPGLARLLTMAAPAAPAAALAAGESEEPCAPPDWSTDAGAARWPCLRTDGTHAENCCHRLLAPVVPAPVAPARMTDDADEGAAPTAGRCVSTGDPSAAHQLSCSFSAVSAIGPVAARLPSTGSSAAPSSSPSGDSTAPSSGARTGNSSSASSSFGGGSSSRSCSVCRADRGSGVGLVPGSIFAPALNACIDASAPAATDDAPSSPPGLVTAPGPMPRSAAELAGVTSFPAPAPGAAQAGVVDVGLALPLPDDAPEDAAEEEKACAAAAATLLALRRAFEARELPRVLAALELEAERDTEAATAAAAAAAALASAATAAAAAASAPLATGDASPPPSAPTSGPSSPPAQAPTPAPVTAAALAGALSSAWWNSSDCYSWLASAAVPGRWTGRGRAVDRLGIVRELCGPDAGDPIHGGTTASIVVELRAPPCVVPVDAADQAAAAGVSTAAAAAVGACSAVATTSIAAEADTDTETDSAAAAAATGAGQGPLLRVIDYRALAAVPPAAGAAGKLKSSCAGAQILARRRAEAAAAAGFTPPADDAATPGTPDAGAAGETVSGAPPDAQLFLFQDRGLGPGVAATIICANVGDSTACCVTEPLPKARPLLLAQRTAASAAAAAAAAAAAVAGDSGVVPVPAPPVNLLDDPWLVPRLLFLTEDHGPDNPREYARVQALDRERHPVKLLFVYDRRDAVAKHACPRVFGADGQLDQRLKANPWAHGLHPTNVRQEPAAYAVTPAGVVADATCIAMTRALGDLFSHQFGLTWEPAISVTDVPTYCAYTVCVASDGVWDCWGYSDWAVATITLIKKHARALQRQRQRELSLTGTLSASSSFSAGTGGTPGDGAAAAMAALTSGSPLSPPSTLSMQRSLSSAALPATPVFLSRGSLLPPQSAAASPAGDGLLQMSHERAVQSFGANGYDDSSLVLWHGDSFV
jgi:hypothetical protein